MTVYYVGGLVFLCGSDDALGDRALRDLGEMQAWFKKYGVRR